MPRRRPYRPRGTRRSPPRPPSGSDMAGWIVAAIMIAIALVVAALYGGCRTGVLCGDACIHASYTCRQ